MERTLPCPEANYREAPSDSAPHGRALLQFELSFAFYRNGDAASLGLWRWLGFGGDVDVNLWRRIGLASRLPGRRLGWFSFFF